MTKKSIIIANWKMKLRWNEAVDLARGIAEGFKELNLKNVPEVVLCPSYTAMSKVRKVLGLALASSKDKSEGVDVTLEGRIKLGAQDVFWEESGAYTGEVSIDMLRDLRCEYFIIGHSERRQYLGETDEMVNKKARTVLRAGGVPIICVGETREERQQGQKDSTVVNQVTLAFEGIKVREDQRIIIAYEPVWVIGTGQAVEPREVSYMANLVRLVALDYCENEENLRIIYGGSVDSNNICGFLEQSVIDGFLVGTAALDAREFLRMITNLH